MTWAHPPLPRCEASVHHAFTPSVVGAVIDPETREARLRAVRAERDEANRALGEAVRVWGEVVRKHRAIEAEP